MTKAQRDIQRKRRVLEPLQEVEHSDPWCHTDVAGGLPIVYSPPVRKIAIGLGGLLLVAGLWFGVRLDVPISEVDGLYEVPQSRFVSLPGGTLIHYQVAGMPGKPTLVLLHGSFDSTFTWEEIIPRLEKDFHIIAPDLPAHGLTGQTDLGKYNVPGVIETLEPFFEKLYIKRFHLAGSSFGGNVAWRYALTHPDQVESLILIGASGFPGLKLHTPQNPNCILRALYRYGNPEVLVRKGMEQAVADPAVITEARVQRALRFLLREGSRDAHAIRTDTRRPHAQPVDRLSEIAQPTLILWGAKDALVPVGDAKRFDDAIADSKVVIFDDLGHLPQIEDPQRTATAISDFLKAHGPPRRRALPDGGVEQLPPQ